jgi:hypothetical protein
VSDDEDDEEEDEEEDDEVDGAVVALVDELGADVVDVLLFEFVACAEPATPAISVPPSVAPAAATPAAAMLALRSRGLRRVFSGSGRGSGTGAAFIAMTITGLG